MATIYKQGSRGEAVKMIQRLVGAQTDGIWGAKTTELVKAWQAAHGLTADGIVGKATIAQLVGVTITPSYISKHITVAKGRQVKYIAIHYTAGASSRKGAAQATRNVFLSRSASADFVVDDSTVVQVNPDIDNYYCWAVGDARNKWAGGGQLYGTATNHNTVSIEICSNLRSGTSAAVPNHEGLSFTDAALTQARNLVRYLMLMYDIPREKVVRHYDITGKLCPGIIGWNNATSYTTDGKITNKTTDSHEWEAFRASL